MATPGLESSGANEPKWVRPDLKTSKPQTAKKLLQGHRYSKPETSDNITNSATEKMNIPESSSVKSTKNVKKMPSRGNLVSDGSKKSDLEDEAGLRQKVQRLQKQIHQNDDQQNWTMSPAKKGDLAKFNLKGKKEEKISLGTTQELYNRCGKDGALKKDIGGEGLGYQFTRDITNLGSEGTFTVFGQNYKPQFTKGDPGKSWDRYMPQEAFREHIKDGDAIRRAVAFSTQAVVLEVAEKVKNKLGGGPDADVSFRGYSQSINITKNEKGEVIMERLFRYAVRNLDTGEYDKGIDVVMKINLTNVSEDVTMQFSSQYNVDHSELMKRYVGI